MTMTAPPQGAQEEPTASGPPPSIGMSAEGVACWFGSNQVLADVTLEMPPAW